MIVRARRLGVGDYIEVVGVSLGDLVRRGEVFGDCGGAGVARDRGAVIF